MAQSKLSYLNECCFLKEKSPRKIYIPKSDEIFTEIEGSIRKVEIGHRNVNAPQKVVMLVGATGSGKSSLLNTLLNHLVGVEWQDDFRMKLIEEDTTKSQAQSQTKAITAYTIHNKPHFPVPFTMTVIDTPGYGDTAGLQKDKDITASMERFFKTKGLHGIDQLDAIGFLANSTLPRLTPTQHYILDSVLALFGKDVAENIFILCTFSDGEKPGLLRGLDEAKMPYKTHFEFNNIPTYATEKSNFNTEFWKMNRSSIESFMTELGKVESRSIVLTQKVLRERKKLEVAINGIHRNIKMWLHTLERLNTEREFSKQFQTETDRNAEISLEIDGYSVQKTPVPPGQFNTNCIVCAITCHENCPIANDDQKGDCLVMSDQFCTVCPKNCHWSKHKNQPFTYVTQGKLEIMTAEKLKERYKEKDSHAITSKELVSKLTRKIETAKSNIVILAENASKRIAKLDKIALRPSLLSTTQYIDELILSEREEGRPRWRERVEQLKNVKWRALDMEMLKDPDGHHIIRQISLAKPIPDISLAYLCQICLNEHISKLAEKGLDPEVFLQNARFAQKKYYGSKCPITMQKNWRQYNATVSRGEARILQALNSEVSLTIPGGSRGVFVSRVHTDHFRFSDVIPDNECIISPSAEFQWLSKSDEAKNMSEIKIPHCLSEPEQWERVIVRKGNLHKANSFQTILQKSKAEETDMYFEVNEKYIVVHTQQLCDFTCTVPKQTCIDSITAFLFGKIDKDENSEQSNLHMKIYLCSKLYTVQDFIKKLEADNERKYNLKLYGERSLTFKTKEFDPRHSKVTMKLEEDKLNSVNWIPFISKNTLWNEERKLFVKSGYPLGSMMDLEGCHLCRSSYPTEAMAVDMKHPQGAVQFKGILDLVVHAAVPKHSRFNYEHNCMEPMPFTITVNGKPSQKKLQAKHLHALSERITDLGSLRILGRALKVKPHQIENSIASNRPSEAAYEVLLIWFRKQDNPFVAWQKLGEALEIAEMNMWKYEVLQ